LGYVNYSEYRPAYPLSLALRLSHHRWEGYASAESEKALFFTKAEDWAYEAEIRLVYHPDREKHVTFDQAGLVAIITGPRFTEKNVARLQQTMQGSQFEGLPIRQARLSKTAFSVEIN
jgi:hypothetical protein